MSNHLTEQNERHGRRHALALAIALHLALAALLYLYTSEESAPKLKKIEPVKIEKEHTQPQAKA